MTSTYSATRSTQLKAEHHLETQKSELSSTSAVRAQGTATERAATEIRGLMGARKLNTVDLAQFLNVSRDTAARRLNGDVDLGLNEVEAIAGWLDVDVCRIIAPAAGSTYSN
jgi:hypothetical protein